MSLGRRDRSETLCSSSGNVNLLRDLTAKEYESAEGLKVDQLVRARLYSVSFYVTVSLITSSQSKYIYSLDWIWYILHRSIGKILFYDTTKNQLIRF